MNDQFVTRIVRIKAQGRPQETQQIVENRKLIERAVADLFKTRGFRKAGVSFIKSCSGVRLAARLSRSTWGPYYSLSFTATLERDEPERKVGVRCLPDVFSVCPIGSLEGNPQSDCLDATSALSGEVRKATIARIVNRAFNDWFARVDTAEKLAGIISEVRENRDERFVTTVKGRSKLGLP